MARNVELENNGPETSRNVGKLAMVDQIMARRAEVGNDGPHC